MAGVGAGCGGASDATSPKAPPGSVIRVAGGDAQTATVASLLPRRLEVTVSDRDGRPVAGIPVTWSVTAGGGSVSPSTSTTDQAGLAVTSWSLGTRAGANGAAAAIAGTAPASFTATGTPGPAVALAIADPGVVTAGDFVQLTAAPADAYGNPTAGGTPAWRAGTDGVAELESGGLLLALGAGATTVTATLDGRSGSRRIPVVARSVPPGTLSITFGPPEVVFHWGSDRCEDADVPDVPARPVRRPDGSLLVFSGNAPRNRTLTGADFGSLRRSCSPALVSADSTTAASYENQEWLAAGYRVGGTIHALVHNEFHDPVAPNCQPGNSLPGNPCWYNSITAASSTDGGATFTALASPAHLVAPAPRRWDPAHPAAATQPQGYFEPSGIVRRGDGAYYAVFFAIPDLAVPATRGLCVMRTATLDDPASWRAWDGSAFALAMASPWTAPDSAAACTIVSFGATGDARGSLTYDTYLGRYLLVGATAASVGGRIACGFFYSLSTDLVAWEPVRVLREGYLPWGTCRPPGAMSAGVDLYPSIVDHADTTVNFERPGQTPWLYYTHFNDDGLDRDLLRRRLIIVKP